MRGINKRGQFGSIQSIVFTLVIVGILISAGFLIMQEFFEQDSLVDTPVTGVIDTLAFLNSTGYTLDGASDPGFNSPSITSMVNATTGGTIASGNYTVSSSGVVTNLTYTNTGTVNITYSYDKGEASYVAINDTIDAMTVIPNLLGIIILIVIVGIIIALVFNAVPVKGA